MAIASNWRSMGAIKPRTSQLERSVRFSPHYAPDILNLRFAHVEIIVTGLVESRETIRSRPSLLDRSV